MPGRSGLPGNRFKGVRWRDKLRFGGYTPATTTHQQPARDRTAGRCYEFCFQGLPETAQAV
jgi:hypothetical protein